MNKKYLLFSASAVALSLIVILGIIEISLRLISTENKDGNRYVMGRHIEPYCVPVEATRNIVDRYNGSENSVFVYDSLRGWHYRPDFSYSDSLYVLNSIGIRGEKEFSQKPPKDTLRIALFGDSYTFGSEVTNRHTWGKLLESKLQESGHPVEVMNFGVGGYGMDQAYLTWKHLGRDYNPDLVLFGFQPENVKRNLNILRTLYVWKHPYSKPRFYKTREGDWQIANLPTIKPGNIPGVLKNVSDWKYAELENYYNDKFDCGAGSFYTYQFLKHMVVNNKYTYGWLERDYYQPGKEPAQVARYVVRKFRESVEQQDTEFLMVHLPAYPDIYSQKLGWGLPYQRLLDSIDKINPVVHTVDHFIRESEQADGLEKFFEGGGHYSKLGNRVVYQRVRDYILQNNLLDKH